MAVYASAGYWGWTRTARLPLRLALAAGAVAVLAEVWGLFGAPTATYPLHGTARVLLELGWFGTGALALLAARVRRTGLRRPAVPLAGSPGEAPRRCGRHRAPRLGS